MERVSKRARKYREKSFRQFKCNEFIDYAMQATHDDVLYWVESLFGYSCWQWIVFGECLELGNTFEISRFKCSFPAVERGTWLKRPHESLYRNASRDFWICVLQRLTSVTDVIACSVVSRTFYQVCRMDVLYQRWIDRFLPKLRGCPNPFASLPLWKQFLGLSGSYKKQWNIWFKQWPQYAFLAIILCFGYSAKGIFIYDAQNWRILNEGTVWAERAGNAIQINGPFRKIYVGYEYQSMCCSMNYAMGLSDDGLPKNGPFYF